MFIKINIKNALGLLIIVLFKCVTFTSGISYQRWKLFEIESSPTVSRRKYFIDEIERGNNTKNIKIIDFNKGSLQIGIGPEVENQILDKIFKKFEFNPKLLHNDIGKLIEKSSRSRKRSVSSEYFDRYLDLNQMEAYFSVFEKSHPHLLRREVVGSSYEGRNISLFIVSSPTQANNCPSQHISSRQRRFYGRESSYNHYLQKRSLRTTTQKQFRQQIETSGQNIISHFITQNPKFQIHGNSTHYYINFNPFNLQNKENKGKEMEENKSQNERRKRKIQKPIIFIDAGTHSREWVSPATALYLIQKIVEDPSMTSQVDWYIIPMVNPDGYVYSWKHDRFWRKTRSKSQKEDCFGVDINRNFDHHWGEEDTAVNPCSEHYGGPSAASEIETRIIKDILLRDKNRMKAYVSLHNWGQDILYPYSYSKTKEPLNAAELDRVSKGMSDAIKRSQGSDYKYGRGAELLYPASGISMDWAHDVVGIPYSFLFELRDKFGIVGFLLPDIYIKPTGEDFYAAMKYLADEIGKKENFNCK